jgi:branched-chain amino acid transport system substrate-binding protein
MHKRAPFALMVILIALVTGSGCRPAGPKGEVIVYVCAPLSGWQADGGQTVVGGVNLMADTLNKAGGLLGYTVKVVAVDDEADDDVAAEVAQQIADEVVRGDRRIVGIVGHYNSGQTLVAMETYSELPVIVITTTASNVALTQKGYRNFFRVNANDAAQAPVAARFLIENLASERIVLVHADNEYGRGLKDQMVTALRDLGTEPVAVLEIKEAADTHASVIPQIAAAQPDAVFMAGYETEGYVLLPEIREAGIEATFMGSDACFLYEFIDGCGPAAEGAYVSGITPDPHAFTDDEWWNDYQVLENRNPGTYSVAGYAAMHVLAEAAERAKTFDSSALADAVRNLELRSTVGDIAYQDNGDLQDQSIYIFKVVDQDFVQVQPTP